MKKIIMIVGTLLLSAGCLTAQDAYECGLNIRAGRISDGMARPRDVVISNGARVVMDAVKSVHLEPGFRVDAGGRLEVR